MRSPSMLMAQVISTPLVGKAEATVPRAPVRLAYETERKHPSVSKAKEHPVN